MDKGTLRPLTCRLMSPDRLCLRDAQGRSNSRLEASAYERMIRPSLCVLPLSGPLPIWLTAVPQLGLEHQDQVDAFLEQVRPRLHIVGHL